MTDELKSREPRQLTTPELREWWMGEVGRTKWNLPDGRSMTTAGLVAEKQAKEKREDSER